MFPIKLLITILVIVLITALAYYFLNKLNPQSSSTDSSSSSNDNNLSTNTSSNRSHQSQSSILSSSTQNTSNISEVDPNKKISKKDQMKMIKKREREELREQQKQLLEAKKQKEKLNEEKMILKEKEKEEEMKKIEEELRKVKEEQEKKENDIYNQWKDLIHVDEEGEERVDFEDENVINNFLNYIKIRKVVSLSDLSGVFKLSVNEVVDRLNFFESQGRIMGIIDDRGKYIYITEKEISMIEKMFIKKGRINKNELIKECNRIIRFEPNEEDKIKIQEEQKKMIEQIENEIGDGDKNKK